MARSRLTVIMSGTRCTILWTASGAEVSSRRASVSVCLALSHTSGRLVCIATFFFSSLRWRAGEYSISRRVGRSVSEEENPSLIGATTGLSPQRVATSFSKVVEQQLVEQRSHWQWIHQVM